MDLAQDDFMYPDDAPVVMMELERRMSARAKADGKTLDGGDEDYGKVKKKKKATGKGGGDGGLESNAGGKWQQLHQQLAESRRQALTKLS